MFFAVFCRWAAVDTDDPRNEFRFIPFRSGVPVSVVSVIELECTVYFQNCGMHAIQTREGSSTAPARVRSLIVDLGLTRSTDHRVLSVDHER